MYRIKLFIYDICLSYCRKVGHVLKEDKNSITFVQRDNNGIIPNPKNPKKVVIRGANGRFIKA